jgi:3-oxoacyl-[acyl-carrier protein] reductase
MSFKSNMGKIIIVTGGSRGIGRDIAMDMARSGYDIAIFYNSNAVKANETKEAVEKLQNGTSCFIYQVSVTDMEKVEWCFKELEQQGEEICGLVNNAGIIRDGFLMTMKEADWNEVIKTNILGTVNCTKAVIPYLKKEGGIIVNMASISGLKGESAQTNYAATKSAIISFTRSMAVELQEYHIGVYAIAPGFIETEMIQKMAPRVLKKKINTIPAKRIGSTMDIAQIVRFLFEQNPQYMVGQVFVPDGGLSCV